MPKRGGGGRRRLEHVDAMRPVKQVGVVATHSLIFFAPAASAGLGASLLITHFTRFGFMFISAAMLVYAYPDLKLAGLRAFWRRRLLSVSLPYALWTAIYFGFESLHIHGVPAAFETSGGIASSPLVSLERFGRLLLGGYYQLYYLVVLMELAIVYPALLWLLRRTRRHHRALVVVSGLVQVVLVSLEHWRVVPGWLLGASATRELWYYQFFVVAGGVMALHYDEVHDWVLAHRASVLSLVALTAGLAEAWYWLGESRLVPDLLGGNGDSTFQPIVVPLYAALVGGLYLLGVWLADPGRSAPLRWLVQSAGDSSYGIYLSQVLFISALAVLGWSRLERVVPWPVVVAGAVVVVYASAMAFTAVLARLPGARATAGRARVPWPAWWRRWWSKSPLARVRPGGRAQQLPAATLQRSTLVGR